MSVLREFRVSTRHSGRRRTVRVKVYDDLAHLQHDAQRWRNQVTGLSEEGWFDKALGVAHAFETVNFDDEGEVRLGPAAGIIRLCRKHLGTSVITHEATHIASSIYRQDWQPEHGPMHDDMDNEEVLCYLVGDLTRRIVDRLYAHGFFTPVELT